MVRPATVPRAEVVSTIGNCVVLRLQWRPVDADVDSQRYQLLTLHDDKIREMAEYRTLGEATKAAKRAAEERAS